MAEESPTLETWLTEFSRLSEGEGATAREICKATGIHQATLSKKLRDFAADGRLVVAYRMMKNIVGGNVRVPVYSIKPATGSKNPKAKK